MKHTPEFVTRLFDEELDRLLTELPASATPEEADRYRRAREISEAMIVMENSTPFNDTHPRPKYFRRKVMSATGNGHKQPLTSQPIEQPLNDNERVAQYALAQDAMSHDWATNPRWKGVERPYTAEDVLRLRGSIHIEHTLARMGAERLWDLLKTILTSMRWVR